MNHSLNRVRVPAACSGCVMSAAPAIHAGGTVFAVALLTLAIALIGIKVRVMSTAAVLLAAAALALAEASPHISAVTGLAATSYLWFRHTGRLPLPGSSASIACAVGATAVALLASELPLRTCWAVAVPLSAYLAYGVCALPYIALRENRELAVGDTRTSGH